MVVHNDGIIPPKNAKMPPPAPKSQPKPAPAKAEATIKQTAEKPPIDQKVDIAFDQPDEKQIKSSGVYLVITFIFLVLAGALLFFSFANPSGKANSGNNSSTTPAATTTPTATSQISATPSITPASQAASPRSKAEDTQAKSNLRDVAIALESYYNDDHNSYPIGNSFATMISNLTQSKIIASSPVSPNTDYSYIYCSTSGNSFRLQVSYANEQVLNLDNQDFPDTCTPGK